MFGSNVKLAICIGVTLLIVGCSTVQKTVKTTVKTNKSVEEVTPTQESPNYLLDQAQKVYMQTGDITLRNGLLLETAQAYQIQQQCNQAQKIIALVRPEINSAKLNTHANVILAECHLTMPQPDYEKLQVWLDLSDLGVGFDHRIYRLKSQVQENKRDWIAASKSVLESGYDDQLSSSIIWHLLQNLNQKQLADVAPQEPLLQQWIQLSLIVLQYGLQPSELQLAVQEWQGRNENHPLSLSLPTEITEAINSQQLVTTKIAVLLPLSGRLSAQGTAIKQGILAAYYAASKTHDNNQTVPPIIQFFDSNTPDFPVVGNFDEYDVIIGPLLKNKITTLLDIIPPEKTVLALNRIDNQSESEITLDTFKNRFYFALAPEDEAQQLAHTVLKNGAKNPVIIADNSAATKRMADSFLSRWAEITEPSTKQPKMTLFTNNLTLRASMTEALDVQQSKARIKLIKDIAPSEVHAVPRNRRDVDAIVVFASAEQTELLNPIIESSLSPFNDKKVPVYATHRSYSLNLSNNSLRDLRNLTFSDMPWMLPQHNWQDLAKETSTLWPQQSDTLRRLFALGYDSFNLLPSLHAMRVLPNISIGGLTGQLNIKADGSIHRSLPYGFIDNDRVRLIAMD
jgi:outer membrane PBP1 activator LpoA protein